MHHIFECEPLALQTIDGVISDVDRPCWASFPPKTTERNKYEFNDKIRCVHRSPEPNRLPKKCH